MLNTTNHKNLTVAERQSVLKRALFSQPFFTRLPFALAVGASKKPLYSSKTEVNRDFYLTEIKGNFGEVFTSTGALVNLSVYSAYGKSVYRYAYSSLLPSGFIADEARFRTATGSQIFDDRQRESFPVLVKNGDKLFANLENIDTVDSPDSATLMLSGFQQVQGTYVDSRTYSQLEKSLTNNIQKDYFKIDVLHEGLQTYSINNDVYPRLVLGFCAINTMAIKGRVSAASMLIRDTSRGLKFSNDPMPVDFIAPRLTCLLDEHIYYLPIEYYLSPYAKLQFDISNTSPDQEHKSGFQLIMLTRTI